jgi:uncharacterized alkaline shock family protein YloU
MLYSKKNQLGQIEFEEKIIGSIIRTSTHQFGGRVMLSDSKGKFKRNFSKERNSDDIGFMNLINTDDGYALEVFVVLKFGTSIKSTTNTLIETIKKQVTHITELNLTQVKIVVTGVMSKNFSKRHIEVIK